MAVRIVPAVAVLTAAAVVFVLVRRDRRLRQQLSRERATHRLTAGRLHQDLEAFRRRINPLLAQHAVAVAAVLVMDDAFACSEVSDPTVEGGPA